MHELHSATSILGGSMTNMWHGRTSIPKFLASRARLSTQFQTAILLARKTGNQWNSERLIGLLINYAIAILELEYLSFPAPFLFDRVRVHGACPTVVSHSYSSLYRQLPSPLLPVLKQNGIHFSYRRHSLTPPDSLKLLPRSPISCCTTRRLCPDK